MSPPFSLKPMPPYSAPMEASAVEGEVVVSGPGNVSCALTPEAAEQSGNALLLAAREARKPGAA